MKAGKLNTQNTECLTWSYEQITVAVLGGVKREGLDRMRVTLKLEWKEHTIRHSLDLYNDTQLEKLTRKCAERFSLGTAFMNDVFAALVNVLEAYRLELLAKHQAEKPTAITLSTEEKKAAQDFLQQTDLLQQTNELIGQSGVIGEEANRLLMYLIFTSRKREHPLHVISLGSSGTGKSHLQEKVGELIPAEEVIEITSLSENAFYYFGKQELKHKLLLIEDLDGAQDVLYPLRELQSKKVINKTVVYKNAAGEPQTTTLRVEGPVCIGGCTTQESVYEDNANRSFLLYLDESREQDARIMEYQRKRSAGKVNTREEKKVKQFLQNVQRVLQPISVRNPFAEYLMLPDHVFKPRRTNAHYLAFIEAVTFYHQFQRQQQTDTYTGDVFIETSLEDIRQANLLMKEILLRKSDDLTGACRNYLERLRGWIEEQSLSVFTNRDVSNGLHVPIPTVKRHNLALLNAGYLQKQTTEDNRTHTYSLIEGTTYLQLENSITSVLDSILEKLPSHQLTGSPPAQLPIEPMKPSTSKQKKASAQ
jgi:hypothetical protein